jgi:hypothetical protein
MSHSSKFTPPRVDGDALVEALENVLKAKGLSLDQRHAVRKAFPDVISDAMRDARTHEVAETRALDGLESRLESLIGRNAAKDGPGLVEASRIVDHALNPETRQTPYHPRASMVERIKRPEVALQGGFAALAAYGAIHTLMQAREVDAEGNAHYKVTPIMLGALQGVLAAAMGAQAVKAFSR